MKNNETPYLASIFPFANRPFSGKLGIQQTGHGLTYDIQMFSHFFTTRFYSSMSQTII
jgi:hypothetical protein